jgi:hypothetical protein
MGGSDHPSHTVLARRLQDYLAWRNANARHRDARVRSYRSRAFHARSIVSCTRSSASWTEPSIR